MRDHPSGAQGGFINVYSEMGKGTTFKAYLPANATPPAVRGVKG